MDYDRYFQIGIAAGTLLSGRDLGMFPCQVDFRFDSVSADWAVGQSEDVICQFGFHFPLHLYSSDAG